MAALSEQQIMTCCACRTFATALAAMITDARSSQDVIAAARQVWWKQVHSPPHVLPPCACTMRCTALPVRLMRHAAVCTVFPATILHPGTCVPKAYLN